jgi:hypothetical protein
MMTLAVTKVRRPQRKVAGLPSSHRPPHCRETSSKKGQVPTAVPESAGRVVGRPGRLRHAVEAHPLATITRRDFASFRSPVLDEL